jgi:DNA-binding sugar fermentation-stimulating protein
MEELNLLMKLDNLIEGKIIKRPSKYIRTPYVADILCVDTNSELLDEELLGHTASLGCCGLADVNSHVLISSTNKPRINLKTSKLQCTHNVYLSIIKDTNSSNGIENIIGINPKLAELLTENALKLNLLSKLQNIRRYNRETVIKIKDIIDSRFDFTGIDETGNPFIMEVKNVPLADYEDVSSKERKKMNFTGRDFNTKVAYFPDGYRKTRLDTVSPRALKHIKELTIIKNSNNNIRCIMCYVIQRTDVNRFQPSVIDPEYRNAFKVAINAGVEVITMVVSWTRNGEAYFIRDDLPISINEL